jgi:ComF family protein
MGRLSERAKGMTREVVDSLFPQYCIVCGERLRLDRLLLCPHCLDTLPRYEGMEALYRAEERLEGFAPFTEYRSDLGFSHHNAVRDIIHSIKYHDQPQVGERLGYRFGLEHKAAGHFADIGLVVPVPLTPSRRRRRGYNQAAFIARGLSRALELPLDETLLCRRDSRGTQTHRSREARWESMAGAFFLSDPERARRRRILLVDDVLTTGATLTRCAQALMDGGAESVSYYTLACGRMM